MPQRKKTLDDVGIVEQPVVEVDLQRKLAVAEPDLQLQPKRAPPSTAISSSPPSPSSQRAAGGPAITRTWSTVSR